ncbi:hypothetical protein VUR80DRAFT_2024 [Thermomyces stellatus]
MWGAVKKPFLHFSSPPVLLEGAEMGQKKDEAGEKNFFLVRSGRLGGSLGFPPNPSFIALSDPPYPPLPPGGKGVISRGSMQHAGMLGRPGAPMRRTGMAFGCSETLESCGERTGVGKRLCRPPRKWQAWRLSDWFTSARVEEGAV